MKKTEIFIFINLMMICFVIFPSNVFGQEKNCLEDFERWVKENKSNDEEIVYTLPCDMVIDEEFRFFIPYGTNITIDTNEYKILIKDNGYFVIEGNELNIIGEGGKDGVIHVENGGDLKIGINNIIATNGTALYIEEGGSLSFSSYYGNIGNIKASGIDAMGIYSGNDIRVPSKAIEVSGENAVGIYCKGDVEIEKTSVIASGNDKGSRISESEDKTEQSIVSESKNIYIIKNYNQLIPDIPEDSGYNIIECACRGTGVFDEEMNVCQEDKIEDIDFPKKVLVTTTSSQHVEMDVEWDFSNYYKNLKKGEDFKIEGKFKEEDLSLKQVVLNDDVVPTLDIYVVEKKPIDNLEFDFQNTKGGYVAILFYDMPYNASKVFAEYSEDGVNWISEEQKNISDQTILFFEDFKLRCFRIKVEGGLRAGYSNIVLKPGFVMGSGGGQVTPDDEQENEDIDGDRGGGGRDDPDRENSESIVDENNKENGNLNGERPEDSDMVIESNDEEKDNTHQQDVKSDKSDEKNIKTDKETNKNNSNNQDNNFNSNNLIMENKIENSLKENLKEAYNESSESSKIISNNEKGLDGEYIFKVSKFNDKLESNSKSDNKVQSFQSGAIIGFGLVISTMLCSIIAVNPGIIKYIKKFTKFK